jgi:hypothetical protein
MVSICTSAVLVCDYCISGTKSRGPLTIPFRIETLKRPRLQSHCRPRCSRRPRRPLLLYRHDLPGANALFVSLKTAFYRSTATGTMRESTRFGATCSARSGMVRGSDFECEFRARRIRVRGISHTNRFTICHEIIMRYTPVRYTPVRCTPVRYTPTRRIRMRYAPMTPISYTPMR